MNVGKADRKDAKKHDIDHRPTLLEGAGTYAANLICLILLLAQKFHTGELFGAVVIHERDGKAIRNYKKSLSKVRSKNKNYRWVTCLEKQGGSMQLVKSLRYALEIFHEYAEAINLDIIASIAISTGYRGVLLAQVLSTGGHCIASIHQLVCSLQQSYRHRYRIAILCKPAPTDVDSIKIFKFLVWFLNKYTPYDGVVYYEKPNTEAEVKLADTKVALSIIGILQDKIVRGSITVYEILESIKKSATRFIRVDAKLVTNPYVDDKILFIPHTSRDNQTTINVIHNGLKEVGTGSPTGDIVVVGNAGKQEFSQAVSDFKMQTASKLEVHYAPVKIKENGLDKILVAKYEPTTVSEVYTESEIKEFESIIQEYLKLVGLDEVKFVELLKRME